METYYCMECNNIYNPAEGDPENGVKPGTPFKLLPKNWRCPVCGAEKLMFEKE